MDLKEIQNFIEHDYLEWNTYFKNQDKRTEAFVIMLKVAEETGELAREFLRSFGYANKKYLNEPSQVETELADVLINTMLLAKCLDINLSEIMTRRMEMIRENIRNKGDDKCKDNLCSNQKKCSKCGC